MIHPLLRLAATQPQLLADHAQAYAGLLGEELEQTAATYKRRLLFGAAALGLGIVAVGLAGTSWMLWAVTPAANLHAPWALLAAPGVAALIAAICALAGRVPPDDAFADLKRQLAADLALLREVGAA